MRRSCRRGTSTSGTGSRWCSTGRSTRRWRATSSRTPTTSSSARFRRGLGRLRPELGDQRVELLDALLPDADLVARVLMQVRVLAADPLQLAREPRDLGLQRLALGLDLGDVLAHERDLAAREAGGVDAAL